MSLGFIDERLDEHVSYGFRGGPRFVTLVAPLRSGIEERDSLVIRPKYFYRALYGKIQRASFQALQAAYIACLGRGFSFRFKDWADYQIEDEIIGTAVGGAGETMQIIKPYVFGARTVDRIIEKPVDSTKYNKAGGYREDAVALAVTEDTGGGPVALAHSVDYDTGILTFTSSAGATIRVTCEFDVPCRFGDDSLEMDYIEWQTHNSDIPLQEVWGEEVA